MFNSPAFLPATALGLAVCEVSCRATLASEPHMLGTYTLLAAQCRKDQHFSMHFVGRDSADD